jgi:Kef-type K+ transport system membrane component KefB
VEPAAQTLLTLGVLLLAGLLADEGSRRFGLPAVTILLAVGLVVGPEALDLLPSTTDDWFATVATIALTLVGFILGGEFTAERLHATGRTSLVAAMVQGLATAGLVSAGLALAGVDSVMALSLGGIAVATAPAATLAIVQEQEAKGPFTRLLLSLVALDDAIALSVFAVMTSAAAYFTTADGAGALLGDAAWEIFGAAGLGLVLGVPAAALTGRLKPGLPTQEEAYGVVLLCAGLCLWLEVSFLLAAIVLGATITNRGRHHERAFQEIERIEWPALIVFFVLAGASLDFSALQSVGWLGFGYVVLRAAGKVVGCALGAQLAGLGRDRRWWLGAAMLPQAGVAIGLSLLAAERFPEIADDLLAVVLSATVIFELTGPLITKAALVRVGETDRRHRRNS